MDNLLTTKDRVSELLQLAIGYSEKQFNVYIREAQDFDLKELLCDSYYYSLLVAPTSDANEKVLKPLKYTYDTDKVSYHKGLELVIAYFAYARFALRSSTVSTSHGFVTKETPHSSPIDFSEKKDLYRENRQKANMVFSEVALYMERENIDYNGCGSCDDTDNNKGFNTRVLRW